MAPAQRNLLLSHSAQGGVWFEMRAAAGIFPGFRVRHAPDPLRLLRLPSRFARSAILALLARINSHRVHIASKDASLTPIPKCVRSHASPNRVLQEAEPSLDTAIAGFERIRATTRLDVGVVGVERSNAVIFALGHISNMSLALSSPRVGTPPRIERAVL